MPNIYAYADEQITSNAPQLVYTVPVNTAGIVTDGSAANIGSEARLVNAYIVRGGGAPGSPDQVLVNQPVQLEDDAYLDKLIGKNLGAGDEIHMTLDAAGTVNVTLSVREIV